MRLVSPASFGSSVKGVEEVQKTFYITGDFNVELGMRCTDEHDIEELNEMYGPLCWQGYDHDPDGYKKSHVVQHHVGVLLQGIFYVV